MEQKIMLLIRYDHEVKGLSYRSLAFKYGISRSMVHRMIKSKAKKVSQLEEQRAADTLVEEGVILPEDVQVLKESLRLANLKIALQDLMIDIAGKELGIDLRKKHGTRQSK